MTDPGSYTFSDPKQSFGTWITQKKRHLSTATHYRFLHKSFLGLYSLSLVLFYALSLAMLALNYSIFPVIGLFVIRTAVQYIIMAKCLRQLNEKDLLPFVAVYEPMLLLLNAGVMISNVIRKPVRWK
jgi:hypothetical protein